MATDISSEFPELIGKSMLHLTVDDLDIITKLPKNHIITYKQYIYRNISVHGIDYLYHCDLVYKTRIICINDATNVYKLENNLHKQFYLIDYKFEFSGIDQSREYDRYQIENNIDDLCLVDKETISLENETHYNKILTIENDNTIITPPNHILFNMFDFEHSKTVQIIKWYLFEDLTVNMWRIQMWTAQQIEKSPYVKKNSVVHYPDNILEFGFKAWNSIERGLKIDIYGFDSELLKEIDRFSWMRRRSAIIRPD